MPAECDSSLSAGIDFSALAEASPYGIIVTDDALERPGPTILYVNPAFERMSGWSRHAIVGETPRVLQGPRTDLRIFGTLRPVLASGATWRGETFNYRRDGSEFLMEWIIAPLRDSRTGAMRYFAIQRDVTARAAMRQRLETALNAASAADRARLDFLAVVGHELRTPLNAVIGFADLIAAGTQGPLSPAYVEYAQMIGEAGQALSVLVENVIDYTTGAEEALDAADIPLDDLLREVAAAFAPRASALGVAIDPIAAPPVAVRGDRRRLGHALRQVIGNAVKFSPRGGRVTIQAEAATDAVFITIDDDGPGFPVDTADRLLAPFVQADMSLARAYDGLGLGLAIARRQLALQGATLALERAPGRGARVRMTIPAGCREVPDRR